MATAEDFMTRAVPHFVDIFPVREDESFQAYCERARAQSYDKCCLIAASLFGVSRQLCAEKQTQKTAWIKAARLCFDPGPRRSCVICNNYIGLTEAHHVVPLAFQNDAGASEPIQEFEWLCPTHHAAQHIFINALIANRQISIAGLPVAESDALHTLNVRFVDLMSRLPCWRQIIS